MSKKTKSKSVPTTTLDTFEGREVVAVALIVTGTGDGLSDAMEIDPTILHHGDDAYLVMRTTVAKIRHDPVKDQPDTLTRVQILKASTCLIADPELVGDLIAKQELRIEEAKGISRLPLVDGEAVPSEDEIAAQAAREDADWETSVTNTLDGINGKPAKAAVKT